MHPETHSYVDEEKFIMVKVLGIVGLLFRLFMCIEQMQNG